MLVETRERIFWRRKRSKGVVNAAFSTNADLSKISGPVAKQVIQRLKPFFNGIDTGRVTLRVSNALRGCLKEKRQMDFRFLEGMEFQRDYPLDHLLLEPYKVELDNSSIKVRLGINVDCVKKQNRLATHFYFEAVLLYGDVNEENSLRAESLESKLFAFGEQMEEECELVLPLPQAGVHWMVALKVSCLEGNEMALHPKHYGMKVVKTG
jgi:hypothetical protein